MSHLTATLPTNGNGGLVSLNGGLNNNALHESNLNSLKGDVNMNLNDKEMIEEEEEQPEVDINISNVVCHFNTKCHLNLRKVAMNGANVEYKREQGVSVFFTQDGYQKIPPRFCCFACEPVPVIQVHLSVRFDKRTDAVCRV